jgi:hypothetical protein
MVTVQIGLKCQHDRSSRESRALRDFLFLIRCLHPLLDDLLPGEQRRMNRTGPVLA